MDTRDQNLTKLTRLRGKSHPTHHRPASLRWNYSRMAVSIMNLVVEDGWWWRRRQIPLSRAPNHQPLPREFRAWRWFRIVKRDESFSLIFFSPNVNIWSWSWGRWSARGLTRHGARPGGRRPHPRGQGVGPLALILSPVFFIYSKNNLRWFSGHSKNFYFCTKITPWQFCWKQRQSGLVPFKSCKLESQTRAKVFGKVDTLKTYQLPQA